MPKKMEKFCKEREKDDLRVIVAEKYSFTLEIKLHYVYNVKTEL